MKTFRLLIFFLILVLQIDAQEFKPLWQKITGTKSADRAVSMVEKDGYLWAVAEYKISFGVSSKLHLIKLSQQGDIIFDQELGKNYYSKPKIIKTQNGNFAIGFSTFTISDSTNFALALFDNKGNQLMENNFGTKSNDIFYDFAETSDGGFIFVGITQSNNIIKPLVIKLNAKGQEQWKTVLNSFSFAYATNILAYESFLIIALVEKKENSPGAEIKLIKTDYNGKVISIWSVSGVNYAVSKDLIKLKNGNIALAGYSYHGLEKDGFVAVINSNGLLKWSRTPGTDKNDEIFAINEDTAGNILLAGYTKRNSIQQLLLVKFDENGNKITETTYGFNPKTIAYDIVVVNNKIFIAGETKRQWEKPEIWIAAFEFNNPKKDKSPPIIKIFSPFLQRKTKESTFTIKGKVVDNQGVKELYLNGEKVNINANGYFEKQVKLSSGKNNFTLKAIDFQGNIEKKDFVIIRAAEQDNSPPEIRIIQPEVTRGFIVVETKTIEIKGYAVDESGIYEVLINGEPANVDENGNFSKEIKLALGENSFTVTATDVKGNSNTVKFTIKRQPQTPDMLGTGKYVALIIGISDYKDKNIQDLENEPVNNAKELAALLRQNYKFDDIILLLNVGYSQIVRTLDSLKTALDTNSNLLIFYAGHGFYDKSEDEGYWLPADANLKYTDKWLYNSVLAKKMKAIPSKHILLISDACFSGSILKSRSVEQDKTIKKKYALKSRKAITSGSLKTVPNKSVFFEYLAKILRENRKKYLSASELFSKLETPVGNNSPNLPQYGVIFGTGDEGGDFIFIHK